MPVPVPVRLTLTSFLTACPTCAMAGPTPRRRWARRTRRRSARRQRAGLVSRSLVQEAAEQHMTLTEAIAVEVQGEQVLEDVVEPLHFRLEDAV